MLSALLALTPMGLARSGGGAGARVTTHGPMLRTIGLIGGMSWESSAEYYRLLNQETRRGRKMVLLRTNTMHQVAGAIEAGIDVPFIHIVDATAERITAAGLTTVGLLGTRFTMEMDFYRSRMAEHGLELLVPGEHDRALVHDVIYQELSQGRVGDSSRAA
jgi:aspartate racemase